MALVITDVSMIDGTVHFLLKRWILFLEGGWKQKRSLVIWTYVWDRSQIIRCFLLDFQESMLRPSLMVHNTLSGWNLNDLTELPPLLPLVVVFYANYNMENIDSITRTYLCVHLFMHQYIYQYVYTIVTWCAPKGIYQESPPWTICCPCRRGYKLLAHTRAPINE